MATLSSKNGTQTFPLKAGGISTLKTCSVFPVIQPMSMSGLNLLLSRKQVLPTRTFYTFQPLLKACHPLDLWPLFSYLWAAQSHTRQLLPVQWAWFTPFLSPTWETEEELKNWTFPDTLHYSLLFTIYFSADVCCVTRKLIQWLLPCAPHMDK